mmetsp:Transcript_30642/g.74805  ORF Transcript_30642/g.74805 Transcript_30642/m.74805 type:complete len:282 (+) Transcript_30642:545-1390(+)
MRTNREECRIASSKTPPASMRSSLFSNHNTSRPTRSSFNSSTSAGTAASVSDVESRRSSARRRGAVPVPSIIPRASAVTPSSPSALKDMDSILNGAAAADRWPKAIPMERAARIPSERQRYNDSDERVPVFLTAVASAAQMVGSSRRDSLLSRSISRKAVVGTIEISSASDLGTISVRLAARSLANTLVLRSAAATSIIAASSSNSDARSMSTKNEPRSNFRNSFKLNATSLLFAATAFSASTHSSTNARTRSPIVLAIAIAGSALASPRSRAASRSATQR